MGQSGNGISVTVVHTHSILYMGEMNCFSHGVSPTPPVRRLRTQLSASRETEKHMQARIHSPFRKALMYPSPRYPCKAHPYASGSPVPSMGTIPVFSLPLRADRALVLRLVRGIKEVPPDSKGKRERQACTVQNAVQKKIDLYSIRQR